MEEGDVIIDIESCLNTIEEADGTSTDSLPGCENPVNTSKNNLKPEKNAKREKRFSVSAKKPPKPPRPPRGCLSLDAADQKLIREISELAMLKRARIERMKELKRLKRVKGSAGTASTGGNVIAMVFTILFCVVVIFQGCHPLRILPSKNSVVGFISSASPVGPTEGNDIVGVTDQRKPSTTSVHRSSGSGSLSFMDLAPVLVNNKDEPEKYVY